MASASDLIFRQGDDVDFTIAISDSVGSPLVVSGHFVKWALAAFEGGPALISKSYPASGIQLAQPSSTTVTVAISGYELSALDAGKYFHQMKVIINSNTDTVLVGAVRIKPSII